MGLQPKRSTVAMTARIATAQEWDSVYAMCAHATYFHSREWAESWERYTKRQLQAGAWLLTFSDGARAVFPFSRKRLQYRLSTQYISSAGGTYGGWISADRLGSAHRELLMGHIRRHMPNLVLRVNPFDPVSKSMSFGHVTPDQTRALSLTADFETITKGFSKGHRAAIQSARKQGVTTRQAVTLKDWKAYYAAYEDSLRRWGTRASSSYSWFFFEQLFHLASPAVRLWIAEKDDEVLAGALCFEARSHVVWWHGATFESAFHLRPANLLVSDVVRDASMRGYAWFDFNPSGGHSGVDMFKKHFGASTFDAPTITTATRRRRVVRKAVALSKLLRRPSRQE
jgi:hypothetical protein